MKIYYTRLSRQETTIYGCSDITPLQVNYYDSGIMALYYLNDTSRDQEFRMRVLRYHGLDDVEIHPSAKHIPVVSGLNVSPYLFFWY